MDYIGFMDECGEHNLDNVDPAQPIFCLAGAIMNKEEYAKKIEEINRVKLKYFDHEGVILHSYKIRNWKEEFHILGDEKVRTAFYEDMRPVIAGGYRIICVSLNKAEHKKKHGKEAMNPYDICLGVFMERVRNFLKKESIGSIKLFVESREKRENAELMKAFRDIMGGNHSHSYFFRKRFSKSDMELFIRRKDENIAGLQLADLIVYPYTLYHRDGKGGETYDIASKNILHGSPDQNFKMLP